MQPRDKKPSDENSCSEATCNALRGWPGSSQACAALVCPPHRGSRVPALLFASLFSISGWVDAQPALPPPPAERPSVTGTNRDAGIGPSDRAGLLLDQAPLEHAESLYKARRYDEAMSAFGVLAATEDHPFAWLRIGNIWHRRGDVPMALDAYVRAQSRGQQTSSDERLAVRATMNIVLLALDQAQIALEALGKNPGAPSDPWAREIVLRMEELRAVLPATPPDPAARLSLQGPR